MFSLIFCFYKGSTTSLLLVYSTSVKRFRFPRLPITIHILVRSLYSDSFQSIFYPSMGVFALIVGSTTSPWYWCSPTAVSIHSSTLPRTTSFSTVSGVWSEKSREHRSLKSSPSPRAKRSRPKHPSSDVFRFSFVILVTLYRRIFVLQPVQCRFKLWSIGGHFGAKQK